MSAEIPSVPPVPAGTWQDVLADLPPHQERRVNVEEGYNNRIAMPEVWMHCSVCDAVLLFRCTDAPWHGIGSGPFTVKWATYTCKHCDKMSRVFGLKFSIGGAPKALGYLVTKLGEYPPFGPPTPARLVKLLGPEREQFLKGRRAESQGFGIGAFGYYRRVVESQRDRLLDAIIGAAERTNASPEAVAQLKKAKEESRFTESMKLAQDALPSSLFINGHNPLKLLHSALSEGLHELPDERCLQLAAAVREVLTALAERLAEVTKEQASLNAALNTLNAPRAES